MTNRFLRNIRTSLALASLAACLGAFTTASAQLDGGLRKAQDKTNQAVAVPQNQVDFLDQMYADLLKRPVDRSSLAQLEAMLSAGATRTQVAGMVINSNEFRSITVQGYYRTCLQRAPNAAEASFAVDMLARLSPESFQAYLLGSGEYYQEAGNSDSAFLQRMYSNVLNRPPSPGELQVFMEWIRIGQSRTSLATYLLGSTEHQNMVIVNDYQSILRRAPAAAELTTMTAALGNGAGENFLIALLFGSPEYLNFAVQAASHSFIPCI